MSKLDELLKLNHVKSVKSQPTVVEISREDFDLLDVEDDVTYHIYNEDGTVTIRKGENR